MARPGETPEETLKWDCHECGSALDESKKELLGLRSYVAWCPHCEEYRHPISVFNEAASEKLREALSRPPTIISASPIPVEG